MALNTPHWAKRVLKALSYFIALSIVVVVVDWYRSSDIQQTVPRQSEVLKTLDGNTLKVVEQSFQEPVLVYFWATWCPYCKAVSPMVEGVASDYAVVSIAFASGDDHEVVKFVEDNAYDFTTVNDQTGVLARRWGVSVTPTILIIRDGKVHSATTGLTSSAGMRARLMLAR